MCGICGVIARNGEPPVSDVLLHRINDTMIHRGPDDAGYYMDEHAALAMRRLSIIDLATGQQPIANEDESVWIVCNGEIYNHLSIRRRLEEKGHVFRTESDTESVLHGYEEYGDDILGHLIGMFGLAIWDSRRRRLLLARDRLGIKPLYYHVSPERLIFGSELKAIIAHPGVPRVIDFQALDQFLTLEYIPSPRSIFKDINKLPPGHRLLLEEGHPPQVESYWDVSFEDQQTRRNDEDYIEELTALVKDAVQIRLMSDVPLGATLSGGIDSSTIVAFMSEAMDQPVQTFSVGFGDPTYNELPFARMVASSFGTQHREDFLSPDIHDMVLRLVHQFDEPFGDFSIFPTYLVSEMARRSVTVALSGDGGDELFGGYDTYVAQRLDERYYSHLPLWLRGHVLPGIMDRIPPRPSKKGLVNKAKRFIEGGALPGAWSHTRWMMFLSDLEKQDLYHPDMQAKLVAESPGGMMERYFKSVDQIDRLAQQQYVDIKTYLAEDILAKVDRMSMATSLEVRVPLLDHRIVDFALNLPSHLKLDGNRTKVILRRMMSNRLPKEVLRKPKEGFSIPLKHWLRTDLRPLMNDLLSPGVVRHRGYFNPETVTKWINEHETQRANHSHKIWSLMVFELWHRQVMDTPREAVTRHLHC